MNHEVVLTVGATESDNTSLEFRAYSVIVNNQTSLYCHISAVDAFVPPFTGNVVIALDGTLSTKAILEAPPTFPAPSKVNGQRCSLVYVDAQLTPSPLGLLGGARGQYYDRNPTSFVFQYLAENIPPHAATVRWTYTVPANRKAFLEQSQCATELEAAGDLAPTANVGWAETYLFQTPSGATGKTTVLAYVQDVAPSRSRADALVGASMELQAGDKIEGTTANTYTATKVFHYVAAKITEFDA